MIELISKENFSYNEINKHSIQGFLYSPFKLEYPDFHDTKGFKFFCFSDVFPTNDYKEGEKKNLIVSCLLYTSDAADDLLCVDLGGRRIIKKKNK